MIISGKGAGEIILKSITLERVDHGCHSWIQVELVLGLLQYFCVMVMYDVNVQS